MYFAVKEALGANARVEIRDGQEAADHKASEDE